MLEVSAFILQQTIDDREVLRSDNARPAPRELPAQDQETRRLRESSRHPCSHWFSLRGSEIVNRGNGCHAECGWQNAVLADRGQSRLLFALGSLGATEKTSPVPSNAKHWWIPRHAQHPVALSSRGKHRGTEDGRHYQRSSRCDRTREDAGFSSHCWIYAVLDLLHRGPRHARLTVAANSPSFLSRVRVRL